MIGLATFWGVVVAGQDLATLLLNRMGDPNADSKARSRSALSKQLERVSVCWPLGH